MTRGRALRSGTLLTAMTVAIACEGVGAQGKLTEYASVYLANPDTATCDTLTDARWPSDGLLAFCFTTDDDSTGFSLAAVKSRRVLETGYSISVSEAAARERYRLTAERLFANGDIDYRLCSEEGSEIGRRRVLAGYFLTASLYEAESRIAVVYTLGTPLVGRRC